jgi:hypothetical protein
MESAYSLSAVRRFLKDVRAGKKRDDGESPYSEGYRAGYIDALKYIIEWMEEDE